MQSSETTRRLAVSKLFQHFCFFADSDFLDYDEKFKCYICNIEKTEFTKRGFDFAHHKEKEHNPWDYIYFLTLIRGKKKSDLNGTEDYIMKKWKKDDISWFPIGVAGTLKDEGEEKNVDLTEIFKVFLKMLEEGASLKDIFMDEYGDIKDNMMV